MRQFGLFDNVRNPFSSAFFQKQNALAARVYDLYQMYPALRDVINRQKTERRGSGGSVTRGWFLAVITGRTFISPNRWRYDWQQVRQVDNGSGFPTTPSDTLFSDNTFLAAINLAEARNFDADDYWYGGDLTDTDDATVSLNFIPNGTVVHMFQHDQGDGTFAHTFEATNSIVVTCQDPPP